MRKRIRILIRSFMERYGLFVLKVPLNPKQTNKQIIRSFIYRSIVYTEPVGAILLPNKHNIGSPRAGCRLHNVIPNKLLHLLVNGVQMSDRMPTKPLANRTLASSIYRMLNQGSPPQIKSTMRKHIIIPCNSCCTWNSWSPVSSSGSFSIMELIASAAEMAALGAGIGDEADAEAVLWAEVGASTTSTGCRLPRQVPRDNTCGSAVVFIIRILMS